VTCSMLLHHVIMTSYCCQRYAESLVTTLCSSRTVRQCTSTPRRARATVELQRLETPNFLAPNLRPPNSPDLCPVDYEIWAVMQHRVNHRSSSSRMRVIKHNWSTTKQRIHPQSVAEINCHSVLSGDRIRQCGTSSGSCHKDTDQCL